jgi:hypothetical protein
MARIIGIYDNLLTAQETVARLSAHRIDADRLMGWEPRPLSSCPEAGVSCSQATWRARSQCASSV